jgi:signal transduction histidine kinase/CheY-like chemotaxis protein
MSSEILSIPLRNERDVVQARQRSRELASLLGFDNQDQIRLATATSEMARNAFRYAREPKVSFCMDLSTPQKFEIEITDSGPGIRNLDQVLAGRYQSKTGLGLGITGTRRLMDTFNIKTSPNGTSVKMGKLIISSAPDVTPQTIKAIQRQIKARPADSPYEEIDRQNQELLKTLQELKTRQEELSQLNHELEDTNRGVVALYAELDERADYLRRASELKSSFLSNVSHEFRTPLNSIISLSRLLLERLDGDLTADQEMQVRYIESSAKNLQEMVNDLLDLAKVEAGKIKIRVKSFTVEDLFSALKGMLKPLLADNTSVELNFQQTSDIPSLRTDDGKVSQILRNFISNAIKFTPQGEVSVFASMSDKQTVIFEVRDTGIGIAEEHHETIFKEFSQIDNPLQDRFRGTGLGLPLCRKLALLLGGSVWVSSEIGKGSSFFTEIPMSYRGEAEALDAELPVPEFHRAPVLLIEDNAESVSLMESYLRDSEYQLIGVDSADRAQAWLARQRPVAIVADVYLHGSPSWGLIKQIRNNDESLPIIVMSVHDEGQRAMAEGVNSFFRKPISREALLRELRMLTNKTKPFKILLVDDNEVSRYILRELLDRPWLDLVEARSGSEALKMVAEQQPDALVLDLLMPDVNGWEVLNELRSHPQTAELPVFIYTSKTLSEAERKQLEPLCSGIIRKDDISSRLSADWFLNKLAEHGIQAPTPSHA